MKTSKSDQSYLMNTARLEISVAEEIDYDDLQVKESKKTPGVWAVVQKSTKKIWFKKDFNVRGITREDLHGY